MKYPRVSFCIPLIATIFCFASSPRAHALGDLDNQATIDLLTSAPWKVSGDAKGWSRTRVFKKSGSFTTDGEGSEYGHWKISDGMVILTFADKHKDTMTLPLDPKGTRGSSSSGEPMTCVLVNVPPKSALAPITPIPLGATGELTEQEKAAAVAQLVSGPWKVAGTEREGWSRVRVFNKTGTFQTQGQAGEYGLWKFSGRTVVMSFQDGHKDTIKLPLDPKGTPGTDAPGNPITFTLVTGQ